MILERCYLIHISLGGKPSAVRIAEAASGIKKLVSELSPEHQLAYTSKDGTTFGFFMKSKQEAWIVARKIISPGDDAFPKPKKIIPSPLRADDQMLVLEIGMSNAGTQNTRSPTWLEFHHPKSTKALKPGSAPAESTGQGQLATQLGAIKDKLGKKK
jgi:hypothetical protein